jgi:hypothetical protein
LPVLAPRSKAGAALIGAVGAAIREQDEDEAIVAGDVITVLNATPDAYRIEPFLCIRSVREDCQ